MKQPLLVVWELLVEVSGFQVTRVFCQCFLEVWISGVVPIGGQLSKTGGEKLPSFSTAGSGDALE